jgi:hypothetical protein
MGRGVVVGSGDAVGVGVGLKVGVINLHGGLRDFAGQAGIVGKGGGLDLNTTNGFPAVANNTKTKTGKNASFFCLTLLV